MTAAEERKARKRVNEELRTLGLRFHNFLPIADIDKVLGDNGFNTLPEAIYCGRDGQARDQVGTRTWLSFSWYKMDSGRYEIVAYVS